MKIAVASQNYRTITPHGGKTRRFMVFEAQPDQEPVEIARIELLPEQVFCNVHGPAPHPIDGVDYVLVGSAGENFVAKLKRRGIEVIVTPEKDPATAVRQCLNGTLLRGEPHPHADDDDHQHHHHHHGHRHGGHEA